MELLITAKYAESMDILDFVFSFPDILYVYLLNSHSEENAFVISVIISICMVFTIALSFNAIIYNKAIVDAMGYDKQRNDNNLFVDFFLFSNFTMIVFFHFWAIISLFAIFALSFIEVFVHLNYFMLACILGPYYSLLALCYSIIINES
ncbi:hypothetical protein NEMIN01_0304 [Nematocida minor]|uniref:uncharacterized protein n=1 Tax=Nematocida minor TaxID=1912983 RepID=UPI0022210087|nr:uncharacterized protein NEMIN01_0304 [Nematocida minor]KAI5189138.1 hypothetical protein NEMIN01_0304 [Nematocida minor]